MRYINLSGSGGPADAAGAPDAAWLASAQALMQQLAVAPDKVARDALIDAKPALWGKLRDWLLRLSNDKCWYSEARDLFSVLEVEHYRPKNRCKRVSRGAVSDGYWWLAFDWANYRLCGKVGNAKKGDFFPLAAGSPVAAYQGITVLNEIPLLLDPACPGDPDLVSFDEDGKFVPHADADQYTKLRVETTRDRLNLDHGRVKKGRQRIWSRCWTLIKECRDIGLQGAAIGPAERVTLNLKKEELRRMVQPDAEFSSVARQCMLKSNIHWVMALTGG